MLTNLTIGVLAHNEASIITELLHDVLAQSIVQVQSKGVSVHICVVANGCTDTTSDVARSFLSQADLPEHVGFDVFDLDMPSKTNAWNQFVHALSPKDADHLLFLDADIKLPQLDIIERSVEALQNDPELWIVSDEPKNVFPADSGFSVLKFVSQFYQRKPGRGKASMCGQFYCANATRLRQITLPIGLLSQDGFIRAMVLTSCLTEDEQLRRILVLKDAHHLHPAYTKLSGRFRYEKRQMMSTTVYGFIYAFLNSMPPSMETRMAEVARLNEGEPSWVARLVEEECHGRAFVVPWRVPVRRLQRLRPINLRKLPKVLAAIPVVVFDTVVAFAASRELRRNAIGDPSRNKDRFTFRDTVSR